MSEYQYYEFQAIDRPLTSEQLAEMRELSSRVELSATRAAFNYSYGNFRGEPLEVLEEYFDALLYIANWGSKQLAFRLPIKAIAAEQLSPYTYGAEDSVLLDLLQTDAYIILNFELREEEGYGWIEGAGLLDPLVPLRAAILRGDLRALYLFWLRGAAEQADWVEQDVDSGSLIEPPLPPGLGQLDAALQAFVEFFEIDEDLIAAAAEASPALNTRAEPLERWLALLPEAERSSFLLRLAQGEGQLGPQLLRRLRELGGAGASTPASATRRSFAEIQAAAPRQQQLRVQRNRETAERARLARLAALAQREDAVWASIPNLLARRTASSYDEAVSLLAELRELALHRGQADAFNTQLAELTAPYAASDALRRRLKEKLLV